MRIGELAAASGVSVQAIRFYEQQKLLRPPSRSGGGYRLYSPADVAQVDFIRNCQGLGFTLKEIRDLVEAHRPPSGRPPGADAMTVVRARLRDVEDKLRALGVLRRRLAAVIARSEAGATGCPAAAVPVKRRAPGAAR